LDFPQHLESFLERDCDVLEEIWDKGPTIPRRYLLSKERRSSVSVVGIRIKGERVKVGLKINFPKSGLIPMEERKHLGFDVDLGARYFRVPTDRWEALQLSTDAFLMARGRQIQARPLTSLFGTVISIMLAWGRCAGYILHTCAP
jgi:hypothetical protein